MKPKTKRILLAVYALVLCLAAVLVIRNLTRPTAFQILKQEAVYFSNYTDTGTAEVALKEGRNPIRIAVDRGAVHVRLEQSGTVLLEGDYTGTTDVSVAAQGAEPATLTLTGEKASGAILYGEVRAAGALK